MAIHCVFKEYEANVGYGWKRKLADDLKVNETNIHTWSTTGKMSAIVSTALDLLSEVNYLNDEVNSLNEQKSKAKEEAAYIIECEADFSVAKKDSSTGLLKNFAENIPDLETAQQVAAVISGRVKRLMDNASEDCLYYFEQFGNSSDRTEQERAHEFNTWSAPTSSEREVMDKKKRDEIGEMFDKAWLENGGKLTKEGKVDERGV